jgi:hypothetical protein
VRLIEVETGFLWDHKVHDEGDRPVAELEEQHKVFNVAYYLPPPSKYD